ncbi:hypothetical protein D9M71_33850 [compost metagenome]
MEKSQKNGTATVYVGAQLVSFLAIKAIDISYHTGKQLSAGGFAQLLVQRYGQALADELIANATQRPAPEDEVPG